MVFSQLLKQVTGILDDKNKKRTARPFQGSPELRQGRLYLTDKRLTLNTIQGSSPLLEGLAPMNNKPLNALNDKEYNQMQATNQSLTQQLSQYGMDDRLFYELYGKVAREVNNCRDNCKKVNAQPALKYQKQACLAGCDLSLPDTTAKMATFGAEKPATISSCSGLAGKGPQYCKSWVPTQGCSKYGPRDEKSSLGQAVEKNCNTAISSNNSGYCVCADGSSKGYVDCGHPGLTCNEVCAPTSHEYTFKAPAEACTPNNIPQLISCSKPGYCYNAITGESVSTYLEKGDPYPGNRKIGGRTYYFRQQGRGPECPSSSYKAPFCPDPTYTEFLTEGCSQPNTKTACKATVKDGWVQDEGLCKTINPNYVQEPCYIDPIVKWEGDTAFTKFNPQGVKIYSRDAPFLRGSASLYFYTALPKGSNLYGNAITRSVNDSNGNLYLFVETGFIRIPASAASCFDNSTILYIGPVPGTKYTYSNDYRYVGGKIGKWGGQCKCPDGSLYVVGDNHNHCGSLACTGGTVISCGKNGAKNAGKTGWAVTCDPGPGTQEGFSVREGLTGGSLLPLGASCSKAAQCSSGACDIAGQYTDQTSGGSCKDRCIDATRTKCPSLGKSAPPGLSQVPSGSDLVNTCKGAFPYPDDSAELAKRKKTRDQENAELLSIAQQVQGKLDSAHRQLNTIGGSIPNKTQQMRGDLKKYRQIYDQLQKSKKTQVTLTAMMEDGEAIVSHSSLSYYIWLVLAISLLIAAIRQSNK